MQDAESTAAKVLKAARGGVTGTGGGGGSLALAQVPPPPSPLDRT